MRAGGNTLTLLSTLRTHRILVSLAEGKKGLLELRRDAGLPAQSTLRNRLKSLEAARAIKKRSRSSFPGTLTFELAEPGEELLEVSQWLQRWLDTAGRGPLKLGSGPARAAIKGLVDGWSAKMLAPLADQALSLTELDRQLTTVSYPTLERRLETMRLNEQVDQRPREGGGTPFTLNAWLRQGMAPMAAAARWESRHDLEDPSPIGKLELDSALKIVASILNIPATASGVCRLSTRLPVDGKRRRVTAFIEVRNGQMTFVDRPKGTDPDAAASGMIEAWFAALIDGDSSNLKLSGDTDLARLVIDCVNRGVFAGGERQSERRSWSCSQRLSLPRF